MNFKIPYRANSGFIIAACFIIGIVIAATIIFSPPAQPNHHQRILLDKMSASMADTGEMNIAGLFPDYEWDTVCFVPAYAYSKRSQNIATIRTFLGPLHQYSFFTTPDTLDKNYGFGFALISKGKLVKFITLPPTGSVRVPAHQLNGETYDRLYFADLNVQRQVPGQVCYPKETSFVRFVSAQNILVGG